MLSCIITVEKSRRQIGEQILCVVQVWKVVIKQLAYNQGQSLVLHCTSLLHIISCVISAHALKNGFFFVAGLYHRGKLSFSRKRVL